MNLHVTAEKMAFFLVRKELVSKDKQEIYGFGFELLLATLLNGILIIIVSIIMDVFWQTLLLLLPFVLIRSNAGGYHAKSHLGCILGFLVVYVIGVQAISIVPDNFLAGVSSAGLITSTISVLIIGAIPHKNRPVTSAEVTRFKLKARCLAVTLMLVGFIGLYFWIKAFSFYSVGMVIAAGSLLVGTYKSNNERSSGE